VRSHLITPKEKAKNSPRPSGPASVKFFCLFCEVDLCLCPLDANSTH
jgi:hypothetical protein